MANEVYDSGYREISGAALEKIGTQEEEIQRLNAEVLRLQEALHEIETMVPPSELMGTEIERWKHLAGRRREIARDALRNGQEES